MSGPVRKTKRESLIPDSMIPVEAEASILGGLMIRPAVLEQVDWLQVDHFYNPRHKVIFSALRELVKQGSAIDLVTIEAAVERLGKIEAIGGISYLGEIAVRVPTPDHVVDYARLVRQAHINRHALIAMTDAVESMRGDGFEAHEKLEETIAHLQRFHERLGIEPTKKRSPIISATDIGDAIREQAKLPLVNIRLGDEIIDAVPAKQAVYLMGGPGGGKTTTALGFAEAHARHAGPVLVASFELDLAIIGARAGGMLTHASWIEVLRYGEATELAIDALAQLPRLHFIDVDDASLGAIDEGMTELAARYPGEPIMLICDYVQIMEVDAVRGGQQSERSSVTATIKQLRRLRRKHACVSVNLSQMSRGNVGAVATGTKVGKETLDTGAESAAIEQDAAVTFTIGKATDLQPDGSRLIDMHVGKGRFGGGDRVVVLRQYGATGFTRVYSDVPAAQVEERERSAREESERNAVIAALIAAADRAPQPASREELTKACGKKAVLVRRVLDEMLAESDSPLVEVDEKRKHASAFLVWTRSRAEEAGKPLRVRK